MSEPSILDSTAQALPPLAVRTAVRWGLWLLAAIVLMVALLPALPGLAARENLAAGKKWRASSMLAECHPEKIVCGSGRTSIFFHTLEEKQPWVEFDLGAPTRFSEVVIDNRRDGDRGVKDRAVPLVLEVGDDQQTWTPLAEQTESFSRWAPKIPPTTARYVRLRSPRVTYLHLENVEIHP